MSREEGKKDWMQTIKSSHYSEKWESLIEDYLDEFEWRKDYPTHSYIASVKKNSLLLMPRNVLEIFE